MRIQHQTGSNSNVDQGNASLINWGQNYWSRSDRNECLDKTKPAHEMTERNKSELETISIEVGRAFCSNLKIMLTMRSHQS